MLLFELVVFWVEELNGLLDVLVYFEDVVVALAGMLLHVCKVGFGDGGVSAADSMFSLCEQLVLQPHQILEVSFII